MGKGSIKFKKITPFEGIFHVREHFSRFVGPVIDKVLGDKRDKGQVRRGTKDRSEEGQGTGQSYE